MSAATHAPVSMSELRLTYTLWSGPQLEVRLRKGVADVIESTLCPRLKKAAEEVRYIDREISFKHEGTKAEFIRFRDDVSIFIMGIHEIFELEHNKHEEVWKDNETIHVLLFILSFLSEAKLTLQGISERESKLSKLNLFVQAVSHRHDEFQREFSVLGASLNLHVFLFLIRPPIEFSDSLEYLLDRPNDTKSVADLALHRSLCNMQRELQKLNVENELLKRDNQVLQKALDDMTERSSSRRHRNHRTRAKKDDADGRSDDEGEGRKSKSTPRESKKVERRADVNDASESTSSGRGPTHQNTGPSGSSGCVYQTPDGGVYMYNVGNHYNEVNVYDYTTGSTSSRVQSGSSMAGANFWI